MCLLRVRLHPFIVGGSMSYKSQGFINYFWGFNRNHKKRVFLYSEFRQTHFYGKKGIECFGFRVRNY